MTWQAIIREAAYARFCKTGDCEAFRLKRPDLVALCSEVMSPPEMLAVDGTRDWIRIQVRVYVPQLKMQIMVDEWV